MTEKILEITYTNPDGRNLKKKPQKTHQLRLMSLELKIAGSGVYQILAINTEDYHHAIRWSIIFSLK